MKSITKGSAVTKLIPGLLCLSCALSCCQTSRESSLGKNKVRIGYYSRGFRKIITPEYSGFIFPKEYHPIGESAWGRFSDVQFDISIQEIALAERLVKAQLPKVGKHKFSADFDYDLTGYWRQYYGSKEFNDDGTFDRVVFVVFECGYIPSILLDYVAYQDGGDCFFMLHVNLDKGIITDLSVNGLADCKDIEFNINTGTVGNIVI